VGSSKSLNMRDDELPSTEKRWEGCPIWCEGGAAFRTELAHLCPHETVRRAMRAISEMSRGKSAIYYSLTGEEYDAVMKEVERRLRAEAVVG